MYNDLTLFGNNFDLFDPFIDDFFKDYRPQKQKELLKTDIIENDKNYELIMDVPGLEKKDIVIEVENGYLTVEAKKENNKKEKNEKHYIRKERSYYTAKRSFYVGEVEEAQVKASMVNGELHIEIPKEEKKVITKKTIEIA
ncbi:Hsp20 family protein [bacterium]|nr:Hsp20 family protein [bacterium]